MRAKLDSFRPSTWGWVITVLAVALCLFILKSVIGPRPVSAATSVFINEIHYDNTGADAGEAVEVAGPAGTNLSGWQLVPYNGATFQTYAPIINLSGTIPNQQSGFGTLSFAIVGLQNGAPDGIALVNGATVVQFLSYEGAFTATNGPANGMLSTDIGVSEAGTEPNGQSLQLSGTGCMYENFSWNAPATATFGALNTGQTSSCGGGDAAPSVSSSIPADLATGVAVNANISITFSESVNATTDSFAVECPPGNPITFTLSASPGATITLDPTANLPFNTQCSVRVIANQITDADLADPPDQMVADHLFSYTTASPPVASNVIINEVDSDTPGTDAAEFVELYDGGVGNTSLTGLVVVFFNGSNDLSYGGAFDLDGRTTDSNGYFVLGNIAVPGVDLTFAGNLLQNGADAVALYQADATSFPTNTPVTTSNLIDAVVYDTADADDLGLLVLINSGQPQIDEDANAAAATDSIQRCPNGSGGARNTSSYIARTPTPDGANNCPAPPVAAIIHDIQGSGADSPFVGQAVITTGIVTARKSNGFFLQEPDASVDLNPATSEGIFVFTSVAPTVLVGQSATVTGSVSEFFALTQITSSAANIVVNSSGNSLPVAIVLTAAILDPTGSPDQLERFEGLRVQAGPLVSVAPTNNFGETFTVLEGVARPLREPGIEISQPVPPDPTSGMIDCCIPRWDENPERLMIDSDGLIGSTVVSVTSNVTFSTVTGPLDFTFGNYKVLPETAPTTTANISAVPVPAPLAGEFTVASSNIIFFNNNTTQRQKAALAIRDVLRLPDVIGLIEILDLASLQALATEIQTISGVTYEARLIQAPAGGAQNVGFLVKSSRVQIDSVTQVELAGCDGTGANCNSFIDPATNQPALLNDRPPLVLRATVDPLSADPRPVIVIVNHLRSFIDIELVAGDGPRVRAKRKAQGEFLAALLQDLQTNNPATPIISIGDYNAFQFNDGFTDPIATIKGMPTADDEVVVDQSPDLVNPNFINLTDGLPADQRYSFIFDGTPQVLDHIIVNAVANSFLQRYVIAHNNSDFPEVPASAFSGNATRPERFSDHDMPVAYFKFPCVIVCPANVSQSNDPGQCGAVVNYPAPGSSSSCSAVTCTPPSGSFFPVGSTSVTCSQTGGGASCSFTVTVNDTEAPTITGASANPAVLWQPNHKMVPVTINYTSADNCGTVSCSLSVSSNEPIDGVDDGSTSPDWIIQDPHHVMLRAERSGVGTGRIYTITITCTDAAGNSTSQTVSVSVPLHQ